MGYYVIVYLYPVWWYPD